MAFIFLDDDSFLLAINELAYTVSVTWRLEVHKIEGKEGGSREHIASLELPQLRSGGHIVQACQLMLRSEPNDSTRSPGMDEAGLESHRAFYPSQAERIIVFSFTVTHMGAAHLGVSEHNFSVVIHTPALLRVLKTTPVPDIMDTPSIPWEEWGVETTRWIDRRFLNGFINDVHGQCYLTAEVHRTGHSRLRLLDFNPYTVRKHVADHPDEPGPAATDEWDEALAVDDIPSRVVRQISVVAQPHIFEELIVSSLPYTETLYPLPIRMELGQHAFCIDDEHVLTFTMPVGVSLNVY